MKRRLRFFRNWRNWLGLLVLVLLAVLAAITPQIYPQEDPANPQLFRQVGSDLDNQPHPPGGEAVLGTLPRQYDVMFTLLWGLRQAFNFGLLATLITGSFGIFYGAVSGYLGGLSNNIMMRIADAFLAFPLLAAIVFIQQIINILMINTGAYYVPGNNWFTLEPFTGYQSLLVGIDPVLWTLILLSWMPYARLINANVLRLRSVDYVLSAQALGAGRGHVILRHILPNAISPAVVLAARDVGGMVILQATFTFIGLGGKSPWSEQLALARNWIVGPGGNPLVYWWTYLPTVLFLILFSVCWSTLGDSLNDWLNPRSP
jgi:ABC-type dipeptide/oligopeptide/nickel transport system permease subunit